MVDGIALQKTAIRIDREAARRAAFVLHTPTLTDTVNEALRRFAQIRAAEELGELISRGAIDRQLLDAEDDLELAEAEGESAPPTP
jgi:Arc/MetJ family transcription regulator